MQITCNSVPFIDDCELCNSLMRNLKFTFQRFSLNPAPFTDWNQDDPEYRHDHKRQMIQKQSVIIDESDTHRTDCCHKMNHIHRDEPRFTADDADIKCDE